jgi:hypothetical protein
VYLGGITSPNLKAGDEISKFDRAPLVSTDSARSLAAPASGALLVVAISLPPRAQPAMSRFCGESVQHPW